MRSHFLPLFLLVTACTGRPPDSSGDRGRDDTGDADADTDTDTDTDTSSDCALADSTGQTGIALVTGDEYAVLYTEGDAPLAHDGYAVVVSIKGTTGYGGVPVESPFATTGFGFLQVYVDVPPDHRGALSRAAVAATTRFAAGLEADADGCFLADRVSVDVSATAPLLLGNSNGGNLAVNTLADSTLDMPDVSGIVMFETPVAAQFIDVELGEADEPNPLYRVGSCSWEAGSGLVCPYSSTPALGWDPDYQDRSGGPVGAVYIDGEGDGELSLHDYAMFGVDASDTQVAFSPQLNAMLDAQGLVGPDRLTTAEADAYWAERDLSRQAADALSAHPGIPLISVGTIVDHVAGVGDHSHVKGAAEVWRGSGSPWVRVNAASEYMELTAGVGPAWTDNPPNLEHFLNNDDVLMEPDEIDVNCAPDQYNAAALVELATRTESGDWGL